MNLLDDLLGEAWKLEEDLGLERVLFFLLVPVDLVFVLDSPIDSVDFFGLKLGGAQMLKLGQLVEEAEVVVLEVLEFLAGLLLFELLL